ncbi:serine/arginine repetitive matrix protein 5-like isoform X2 [Watersipora subatra]|uniref:serine/arginine repetitive matrix protein 5-like isoform X2 n=1 Tax=Watersipora subatra TaxID=2589382 RepID=UPI00355BC310
MIGIKTERRLKAFSFIGGFAVLTSLLAYNYNDNYSQDGSHYVTTGHKSQTLQVQTAGKAYQTTTDKALHQSAEFIKEPFKAPNKEPIKEPNKEPIQGPSKEPIKELNKEPIQELNKEPIQELNKEPIQEPSKEPIQEPSKEPIKEPSKEPIQELNKEPIQELSKEPIQGPSKEPIQEPSKEPIKEPSKEPIQELNKEPIKEPSKEPIQELSKEPIKEPSGEPIKELNKEPIQELNKEPIQELSNEPIQEPSKEPIKEPNKKPIQELNKKPIKEPSKETIQELSKEPIKEPSGEPIKESNKEPNNEPSGEPIKKPVNNPSTKPSNHTKQRSTACQNVHVEKSECQVLGKEEKVEPQRFPLQFLSGAPGSGNDWLLWLASLSKYTWPRKKQQSECSYYGDMIKLEAFELAAINSTNCLFLKNHEPWGLLLNPNEFAVRSTLLLRHPFDAAFSEYKRIVLEQNVTSKDLKTSADGLTVSQVYDVKAKALNPAFKAFLQMFLQRWLQHTDYWLNKYDGPLHILIYNVVKKNTTREIEKMQRFFGYKFDGVNFRRHCCVMADSTNPSLIRQKSEIDSYKGELYHILKHLTDIPKMDSMLEQTHMWLDKRFPRSHYRIGRG